MIVPAYAILALVAFQRLTELVYASRNTRALKAQGGVEHGRSHYRVIVMLHTLWLLAIGISIPRNPTIYWLPLALFILLQLMRIWVIATLGRFWTTRIVTLPGEPLIRVGPYRYFRHPNYLIVIAEIATLPMVFGQLQIAAIFSVLNLCVLAWRMRIENMALAPRFKIPGGDLETTVR